MKLLYALLLLLLAGCVLNAEQERSLNEAQRHYTDAFNEGDVTKYVGMTHPNVVAHYKMLGDSTFKTKFDLAEESLHLQDGTIRQKVKKDNSIQALIEFKRLNIDDFELEFEKVNIIAVSEDNGKTWFFIEGKDYSNEEIMPKDHQLITIE